MRIAMRPVYTGLLVVVVIALFAAPSSAASRFDSLQGEGYDGNARLLEWVYSYRDDPEPDRLPEAVQSMKKLGLFRDSEKADFFVGFIAGVLGANQMKARELVDGMFPMPPKEQAVIIKAIAWSGLPDWPSLLSDVAPRMPHRQELIQGYLFGELPTLMRLPLEKGTSTLYALWGYYVATGYYAPVSRLIPALRWSRGGIESGRSFMERMEAAFTWSEEEDNVELAMIGGTAKWTLVSHAERDRHLIDFYRAQLEHQDEKVAARLREVIEAAESFESEQVRKEELAAIEEIKRRNPEGAGFNRATTFGSVAIATGCVAATAAGQGAIAVPCIVTGAVYSGFVRMLRENP
jgi:predicted nucleic acid-binding protein